MVSNGRAQMSTPLDNLFLKMREEKRAALIAYIPAGFPTVKDCHRVIQAFVDGGVDAKRVDARCAALHLHLAPVNPRLKI